MVRGLMRCQLAAASCFRDTQSVWQATMMMDIIDQRQEQIITERQQIENGEDGIIVFNE
jgi:hypothetical protein